MPNMLSMNQEVVVRSTGEFVYNVLRKAIVTHKFPAGHRLVEAKTAKELNVSVTPVREAFARLANQGLLTVFPYKGTYVTAISKQYVDDVYFLRRRLEVMAAERGFSNLTDEHVSYYEQLCHIADEAFDKQNLYESIRCDILFHEQMFSITNSMLLMEMWNVIKYRIENIQSYTKPVMNARVSVRHRGMLDAIRQRDQEKYIKEILEHLNSNLQNVYFPDEKDIHYD